MTDNMPGTLYHLSRLILVRTQTVDFYHPHFKAEEVEVKKDEVIPNLNPGLS